MKEKTQSHILVSKLLYIRCDYMRKGKKRCWLSKAMLLAGLCIFFSQNVVKIWSPFHFYKALLQI